MADHAERAHRKYSGSKIKRLGRCKAFARLNALVGRSWGDNEHAREGTARHELLERYLLDGDEIGREQPTWTPERFAAIRWVIDYVAKLREQYPDLQVFTEQDLDFPQDVVKREDCGGVADVVMYSLAARRGWLLDFKNGVIAVDDPVENDQLWFYATAAFWNVAVSQVTLVIVQPNALEVETVREHTLDAVDLVAYQETIRALLMACEDPHATLTPGDWCTMCDVGTECSARERAAIGALTESPGTLYSQLLNELPKAEALDPYRWARARKVSKFVKAFFADIDRAAFAYAMSGGRVPGEKVAEAPRRRVWLGTPQETAAGLAALTGRPAEDFIKVEAVGITEAEKALADAKRTSPDPGGLAKRFSLLTDKKSSGNLTLVPLDDPRPEYNPAATNFTGVVPADLVGV